IAGGSAAAAAIEGGRGATSSLARAGPLLPQNMVAAADAAGEARRFSALLDDLVRRPLGPFRVDIAAYDISAFTSENLGR
ncbi:MAG: hypothetical protein VXV97_07400, partial [Pseudomonadota bacterium]|nr:hypothetical protein [Pseudomonadota bacterium]